jgi:hypothetical protein
MSDESISHKYESPKVVVLKREEIPSHAEQFEKVYIILEISAHATDVAVNL